jgi:hypothetical protein
MQILLSINCLDCLQRQSIVEAIQIDTIRIDAKCLDCCEWPGPCTGSGTRLSGHTRGVSGSYVQRSGTFHGVRTHCRYPGIYRLIWPRGGPGAIHVVGSGAVHHATRDSRAGTVSSHCSKGYPCFRVLTVAPGPASGEETSLQVGPKL